MVDPPDPDAPRSEFLISVESEDETWVLAMADIAYQHRGKFNFRPGGTIKFHGKISDASDMSSFFVWYQGVISEDHEIVCLPQWHVRFLQLFPIHDDERELIQQYGYEWLVELVDDPFSVSRLSVADQFESMG